MPQSLSRLLIHSVFSTKNRIPYLRDTKLRAECFAYLGGIAGTLDCSPLIVGGHEDHVHLLTTLPRTRCVAEVVKEMKRVSSKWAKEEKGIADFMWQSGYGVFSVSESQVGKLRAYIENQDVHHQTLSFQEEYRQFLKRHQVSYDERYVWD